MKKSGCPAWIRTMNNASKGHCVTVTPQGKNVLFNLRHGLTATRNPELSKDDE